MMRVYICPMCLNTVTRVIGTTRGLCKDCNDLYELCECGISDREPTPDCIEVRA